MIVDSHMEVVKADPVRVAITRTLDSSAEHLPATTVANLAQLLHVDMEELARAFTLVAHHGAGGAVDEAEP